MVSARGWRRFISCTVSSARTSECSPRTTSSGTPDRPSNRSTGSVAGLRDRAARASSSGWDRSRSSALVGLLPGPLGHHPPFIVGEDRKLRAEEPGAGCQPRRRNRAVAASCRCSCGYGSIPAASITGPISFSTTPLIADGRAAESAIVNRPPREVPTKTACSIWPRSASASHRPARRGCRSSSSSDRRRTGPGPDSRCRRRDAGPWHRPTVPRPAPGSQPMSAPDRAGRPPARMSSRAAHSRAHAVATHHASDEDARIPGCACHDLTPLSKLPYHGMWGRRRSLSPVLVSAFMPATTVVLRRRSPAMPRFGTPARRAR